MKARDRIIGLLELAGDKGARGSTIMQVCGLWAGSFAIAIMRLEREGVIEGNWVAGAYPRGRVYRLAKGG